MPLASRGINPGKIRALVVVVSETSESEVAELRWAAVLLGNDVIDLEGNR